MGNLFGRITGRSGPYFVILSAVVAKDLALLLRRKQNFNVLDIFHKLLSGGGFIRTCIADAFGLALVWRIIQYCLAWNVFFRKLSWVEQKEQIMGAAFSYLQLLPFVSKKIRKERDSMEAGLRKSLKECDHLKGAVKYYKLPTKGRSTESIISEMESYVEKEDFVWKEGFVSGAVYHGEANHLACQNEALTLYSLSNPLHPELWPSLRKYEAEIISMTASFLNGGDENVVGSITSGGTESIFMAVKSHREYGWRYKGISLPEIIVPVTAHAAFEKACEALKVQCIKLPVDQTTFQVDPADVKGRLTGNTILIVGSAPNYPQGTIDRISELSDIAASRDIGLHVDMCLGGFFLPFARSAGFDLPAFDFSLPGVTSISCDTHKYGYAAKGTSVVLYRNKQLRECQYWTYADWTGGLYCTPTMAGSRAGGLSAACWASMIRMGREGYETHTRKILKTRQKIQKGIVESIPELEILGNPQAMVLAWRSSVVNVYELSDKMGKRKWSINSLQKPASSHICVTYRQCAEGVAEKFIAELRECVDEILKAKERGAGKSVSPKETSGGSAPIYGSIASLPPGPVNQMICSYMDVVLEV